MDGLQLGSSGGESGCLFPLLTLLLLLLETVSCLLASDAEADAASFSYLKTIIFLGDGAPPPAAGVAEVVEAAAAASAACCWASSSFLIT